MKGASILKNWSFFSVLLYVISQGVEGNVSFTAENVLCPEEGKTKDFLNFPKAYSTNIRFNFLNDYLTMEVRLVVDEDSKRSAIEIKSNNRHVKYIGRADEKTVLAINYRPDQKIMCDIKTSIDPMDFLEAEDRGPNNALPIIMKKMGSDKFTATAISTDNSIYSVMKNGCFKDPDIDIAAYFSDPNWMHPDKSSGYTEYPVSVFATMKGGVRISALFSNFNPTKPADREFQPPEDVNCKEYKGSKKIPEIPDYFTFNSEIVVYEGSAALPLVSHRKVFYDYPAGISLTEFYDPLSKDSNPYFKVTAKKKSVILDYKSGIQYTLYPELGSCTVEKLQTAITAVSAIEAAVDKMPNGKEYFLISGADVSYNGEFTTRGLAADVFTTSALDPSKKNQSIISWYFSTASTQVVENDKVEQDVLLRMIIQPETRLGKKDVVEVNFYNFIKQHPDVSTFDLSICYNESSVKHFVLTFPGNDKLKGSENLIRKLTHLAIMDITKISQQRIIVREVTFSGGYIYVEFSAFDNPPIRTNNLEKEELSLQDVVQKLTAKVSSGTFNISVQIKDNAIVLRAQPDGLNVFSGDRVRKQAEAKYKEGSVVAITVGMLCLGFLLGLVTLNLIVSKKFGVSVFQKAKYGDSPFSNQLGESSM